MSEAVLNPHGSSIVGARLCWTCALCKANENTYQLTHIDAPQDVAIPPGWRLHGAWTICAKHPTVEGAR